ncbi:MAG: YicC family protein [Alphaproteobacteria bacterium]|nr:YicC family protein [Alphaproteobacteria bacterium]
MTGFAQTEGSARAATGADGEAIAWSWSWELRSVNSKGLDLRIRLPHLVDVWETKVRARAQARVTRGSVTINWTIETAAEDSRPELVVNEAFLAEVVALRDRLTAQGVTFSGDLGLDRLLAVRGVVDVRERAADTTVVEAVEGLVFADLDRALDALIDARMNEGARLKDTLLGHLDTIAVLTEQATIAAEAQPAALRQRIQDQLALLLDASPPVPEERMAQELALLATKADVREETDRLTAHVDACRAMLTDGGAIGRKLDFLCQELNREANTLCSKAIDLTLTNIGVELKTAIERFREQIQNVE